MGNLDVRLNVRLRRDELDLIHQRADLRGLSISNYIRFLVEQEIKGADINRVCSGGESLDSSL